ETWAPEERALDVAFGDFDGDGRADLAIARSTESSDSWLVYSSKTWTLYDSGGADWPSPRRAANIAVGHFDGDKHADRAVTRDATSGARWYVYRGSDTGLSLDVSRGWDGAALPTDIAFGNLDADNADELVVSRAVASGARMYVYDRV